MSPRTLRGWNGKQAGENWDGFGHSMAHVCHCPERWGFKWWKRSKTLRSAMLYKFVDCEPFHTELSRMHWIDHSSVSIEHLEKKKSTGSYSESKYWVHNVPTGPNKRVQTNKRTTHVFHPSVPSPLPWYLRPWHRGRQTIRHLLQLLGIHGVQLSPGCMDQAEIAHLETCGLRDTQRWWRKQFSWWMNQTKLDS